MISGYFWIFLAGIEGATMAHAGGFPDGPASKGVQGRAGAGTLGLESLGNAARVTGHGSFRWSMLE